jgi:ppGpp synthetase/RelA/SpoT-type nucleotidyltranferase
VIESIRNRLAIDPTGRPEKTPESIIAKLRRTKIELGRMQDIAGCRITVDAIPEQNRTLAQLIELFPVARVADRRLNPSFGYRAVHVIPVVGGASVEIQLRTVKQDFWASISEAMADRVGMELKYGEIPAGAERDRQVLDWSSLAIAALEDIEADQDKSYGPEFNLGQAAAILYLATWLDRLK